MKLAGFGLEAAEARTRRPRFRSLEQSSRRRHHLDAREAEADGVAGSDLRLAWGVNLGADTFGTYNKPGLRPRRARIPSRRFGGLRAFAAARASAAKSAQAAQSPVNPAPAPAPTSYPPLEGTQP